MFTEYDSYLFHEGTLYDVYKKMGAHICEEEGKKGVRFAVWAQHAKAVSVVIYDAYTGEKVCPMEITQAGIWEVFVPDVQKGTCYKYQIKGADGTIHLKADPWAFYSELRPANGSVVYGLEDYPWTDDKYMHDMRHKFNFQDMSSVTLKSLDEDTARRITGIQNREADAALKKNMDDARWYVSEKIWAEKQNWEKAFEKDHSVLPEGMKLPASVKLKDSQPNEKDASKTDIKTKKNSSKEKLIDGEQLKQLIDEFWKDKTEKTVLKSQEGIVRKDPEPFDSLSDDDKKVLFNRCAAEMTRERPMSIYEVHLGSWKQKKENPEDETGAFYNYEELADLLIPYVKEMGYNYIELR